MTCENDVMKIIVEGVMVAQIINFIKKVVAFFWYASFGPDVSFPVWQYKSGRNHIYVYNNDQAVRKAIAQAKREYKATIAPSGAMFTRLHKVVFKPYTGVEPQHWKV